jgi:hypothetical protein
MSDESPTVPPISQPDPFAAYPDDQGERRWHVVFGALCLAYGLIGTIAFGLAVLAIVFGPLIGRLIGRDLATPAETYWLQLGQSVLLFALGTYLAYGAWGMLRRRVLGYRRVVRWAGVRLAFGVLQLAVSIATIDITAKVQVEAYEKQMSQLPAGEREKAEGAMRSFGMEPPTVESVRSSLPKWIGIMTGAFSIWPLVVGIALTSKRCREDVKHWS